MDRGSDWRPMTWVGETSPRDFLSKAGDTSTNPELNMSRAPRGLPVHLVTLTRDP